MAHAHYVLDLFYVVTDRSVDLRREVVRLAAKDDAEAVAEGVRISGWKKADRFDIRSIQTSARADDRVVHASSPSANSIAARSTIVIDRYGTASAPFIAPFEKGRPS